MIRRLHKEGEERKANFIFLAITLIGGIPLVAGYTYDILTGSWKMWKFISIFVFVYLIGYGILRVKKV